MTGLTVTGLPGCSSHPTATPCAAVGPCSTAAAERLGQAVLVPRGATFVQGSINNGVLVIGFSDPRSGLAYKEFVGRPKSPPKACVGTVMTVTPTRQLCYGPTRTGPATTGLNAQFTVGSLVYIVLFTAQPADASSDQALLSRIVLSMS